MPVGIWASEYESIPPDDPQYQPPTATFNSDNLRLVNFFQTLPPSAAFKGTFPANGFELPSHDITKKWYKYSKVGENLPRLEFELVEQDPQVETDGDGITESPTYVNFSQKFDLYALVSTQLFYFGNKPHRDLFISGRIPIFTSYVESNLVEDEFVGYQEDRHKWADFSVTYTATHDTNATDWLSAPVPPQRILIYSWVNEYSSTNTSYRGYTEISSVGGINGYLYGWALTDGGYPKFKE